jgi:hypothetical protein
MRIFLLAILLTTSIQAFADYGTLYFFKCKVVTAQTILTGYFNGHYEFLADSTLSEFKKDSKYFKNKLFRDLNKADDSPSISIVDFVYIHEFLESKALYVSKNSVSVNLKDIQSLELLDVVSFRFEPFHVISAIEVSDTVWTKKKPLHSIDDKKIDDCCPDKYLIYDETKDYKEIINKIILQKDELVREKLLNELRKYKIVALRLCWCG